MLGKKRNNSVFLKEEKHQNGVNKNESSIENEVRDNVTNTTKELNIFNGKEPGGEIISSISERAIEILENPEIEERNKIVEVEKEIISQRELGTDNRTHSLFFTPESDGKDFSTVLKDVQEYISNNYSILITDETIEGSKEHLKRYISKYVQDSRISVKGMSRNELIDALYSEMAEFGFLTKYIYGEGIEEIDINSWNDIEIQYSDGRCEKLDEHFDSPEHAINVIRRMLHISGMILDNASPAVLGHLSKNIRIAVLKTPLVDEDVGIAASIRIVNPQNMKKEDFVNGGTATNPMLDFLSECIRYGISVCIAGATSSGKTTVAGWLLTTIPDNKRIFTIENGSRELSLVRKRNGRVSNSVIHTITRDSENERQRIDQITLLDMSLRFNPDIIVVGEMRGAEANAAQEAARTGVAVLTTIHSNSCEATYRRMVSLCKRAVDMTDETLMGYVTEAYPIVVFCKQLENKERKLMEIMECEILSDGTRNYRPLFQYIITENRMEDGEFIIKGYHEQTNSISESLSKRFLENGMPISTIGKLKKKEVQSV
ncbi:CpaF/VirB11 family protein [Schnuerera sp. xch1]|uniref:ATPase, T2SS/T4P/T4SS family n=1 Tax=Schnuerera sp. xch1 TaxID=2874283 RepID=UPI001CC048EE|nr:CpaF/VirB11 family protein [Schnuerera sp. xch1]MBZ2175616.1 CpaF/VirB11 family protein [Schnuerera sp. xch1]